MSDQDEKSDRSGVARFHKRIMIELDTSKDIDPEISEREIYLKAARDLPDKELAEYFSDVFRSPHAQKAARAARIKEPADNRGRFLEQEQEKARKNVRTPPRDASREELTL